MSATQTVDFGVQHHFSLALLRAYSDAAREWCEENLFVEDEPLMWGGAYVVEPRYLEDILRAIVLDGLTVRLHG